MADCDDLARQNAVLRLKNKQLQERVAELEQTLDLLKIGLTQGMAPEVAQFTAVFENMLRLLK